MLNYETRRRRPSNNRCYGVVVAMYGVPYRLTGSLKVQSPDNLPLPDIQVSFRQWSDSTLEPSGWTILQPTDQDGKYSYNLDPEGGEHLRFHLEDVDGVANQGQFLSKEVLVDEPEELVTLDPAP